MNKRIISISSLVIATTLILLAVIFWGSKLSESKLSVGMVIIASIFLNLARDVYRLSLKLTFIKAITCLVLVILVILKLEGIIYLNSTLFWVLLIVASSVIIYKEISERSTDQD